MRQDAMDERELTNQTDAHREALSWLADYGDDMFAYAVSRVGDSNVAEDLVQETYLAALRGYDRFDHRSAVKTWLISILRRKIVDHFRSRSSAIQLDPGMAESIAEHPFSPSGHWKIRVGRWAVEPWEALDKSDFWTTLDECLRKLRGPLAEAFILRMMDRLEVEETCELLGITTSNLSVRLHRARLAVRRCLEKNWFGSS